MNYQRALWLSWAAFGVFIAGYATAQSVRGPEVLPGCIYNLTLPTLSTGQATSLQCDVNGKLRVTTG